MKTYIVRSDSIMTEVQAGSAAEALDSLKITDAHIADGAWAWAEAKDGSEERELPRKENNMSYDATSTIANIPWTAAPSSDSALRAFARRHNFAPKRTTSGKWAICWSSQSDAEQYDSAIEAIREEVRYQQGA